MSENGITVETAYLDAYNAIVRPEQIFRISRYFLKYWLPQLTPATTWLIVELRQQAYRANGKPFQVDQESLARGAAVTKNHANQILNVELKKRFVDWKRRTKYLPDYNRNVHDKNRYIVFADEPLAAVHAAGLMTLFANDVDHVADLLRELIDADADALLERIEVAADGNDSLPAATGQLLTVADVFAAATGQPARGDVAGKCSKLQRKIIASAGGDVVMPQYFRRAWLPLLGHALAWLVVVARAHCYDDPKKQIVRDTFSIEKSVLAGEIGQSTRNLMRLLGRKHATEFIHVDDDESTRHTLTMTVPTWQSAGEVLTPSDRERWQTMLAATGDEPDKIGIGKRGEPDKIGIHVPDKIGIGKRGEPDKIGIHVPDKIVERLNTPTPDSLNTTTTPPGGVEGGGGGDVFTDDERRQKILAIGVGAADEFKSVQGLTSSVLDDWSNYMKYERVGGGVVVTKYWREKVWTPPAPAPPAPSPKIFRADPAEPPAGSYNQNPATRAMLLNASRGQFNTTNGDQK